MEDSREDRTADADDHSSSSADSNYKLFSSAHLNSVSVPPGLAPPFFFHSPLLISHSKEEPSPHEGSFSNSRLISGADPNATCSFATTDPNTRSLGDMNSNGFAFKRQSRPSSASGASTAPMVTTGFSQLQSNLPERVQDPSGCQQLGSSSVKCGIFTSSKGLSSSANDMLTSGVIVPSSVDDEESNKKRYIISEVQTSQSDNRDMAEIYDGYNWRKYGQKLVKGCEFPRSYYKCTYPNCEVKKTFERSHDGQTTEIVYKGIHDHPKPQSVRRLCTGAFVSTHDDKKEKVSSLNNQEDKYIINSQTSPMEPNDTPLPSPRQVNISSPDGLQLNSNNCDVDEDGPISKRRKLEGCGNQITPVVKPIREPRVVVQTVSEVDILDDGYRWRKYGQKVVRGNPNPRSYYKCTNAGCAVRKHVERACHDPKAVLTTYEGKHNHNLPASRANNYDISGSTAITGMTRVRPEERDAINLDLGVGASHGPEHRSCGGATERAHNQASVFGASVNVPPASSVVPFYRIINGSMGVQLSRENLVEGLSFGTLPLNHSNRYPQHLGRILLGP